MLLPKFADAVNKVWWDNKWKKSKVMYQTKSNGYVDVRTALRTGSEGWLELVKVAKSLLVFTTEGAFDEDKTMAKIANFVNKRTRYVPDINKYGKNEFWADAYDTYIIKEGDCDDYSILIKMLSIAANIPDWRVKCCCLDLHTPAGIPSGGHMNVLYLQRSTNEWIFVEGSWTMGPDTYGNIWFTFNRENAWAQHDLSFDRYGLQKLKQLATSVE